MSSENLFSGVFPTGISYADRSREEHGDYKKIAFLSFSDLRLEIYAPRSSLLPEIKRRAEALQAKRGEQFQTSTSGQTVTLGYALPAPTPAAQ